MLDVPELKQAVSAQLIASPHPYKKDYKEQIVGKGPHDPSIGYPEHEQHKKASVLASQVGSPTMWSFTHMEKLRYRIYFRAQHCFELSGLISAVGATDIYLRQYICLKRIFCLWIVTIPLTRTRKSPLCRTLSPLKNSRHYVCAYSSENIVNIRAKVAICNTNVKAQVYMHNCKQ